ncbi:hypothetical protein [Hydrogenophaga taeniospiralis]|uniref:hypothetical protein n=1 Tax=Hydrogenophaga taeniospiralis TaxID=65656 RepID=UPI000833E0A8|nr:hypothetical protein [Hydrogenophaga taeniospiralis]
MFAKSQAQSLLKSALSEIAQSDGIAATDRFSGLREVDAKVREVRMILEGVEGLPPSLLTNLSNDIDFQANSRRIRLEALANYIKSALKFLDTGAFEKPKKIIHAPPNFSQLTASVPGLREELEKRWRESQKCIHVEAYTSAVILMGSVLEGALLARAQLSVSSAYQAQRAPRDKTGKSLAIQDWTLSALIDVAVELGWVKSDRGKFSHALRESRNVVHPWQAVMIRAAFDQATCVTSWSVLEASVEDLLSSLP